MEWNPQPAQWLRDYNANGYVVVENAIDPETIAQLTAELDRIERQMAEGNLAPHLRSWISTERERTRSFGIGEVDSDTISNIMELPIFAPVFRDLIIYPRVLDILEALFQSSEYSFHNYKCICKMPGNIAPFAWHRDLPYLQHTSPNLITCMLCLDPMTKENGGTVVCPGSHLIPHEDVKPSDIDITEAEVPAKRVTVECPAGSAVLFHVNLVHGGGPNLSQTKRRNAISIWAGDQCYPTTGARYAYEFVKPRSSDPLRQKEIALTFKTN